MEYTSIALPSEYWKNRKAFLKNARSGFLFGKVRMVRNHKCCRIIFYHNTHLYYLVHAVINFGAWMQNKGYKTLHEYDV